MEWDRQGDDWMRKQERSLTWQGSCFQTGLAVRLWVLSLSRCLTRRENDVLSVSGDLRHCSRGQVFVMSQSQPMQNWTASWSLNSRAAGCGSSFGSVGWWMWIWGRRSSLKTLLCQTV